MGKDNATYCLHVAGPLTETSSLVCFCPREELKEKLEVLKGLSGLEGNRILWSVAGSSIATKQARPKELRGALVMGGWL